MDPLIWTCSSGYLGDERRLAKKNREQREQLAAEVIRVFDDLSTGEADLLRAISKRRKP